jgi:hypothetical protein
MVGEFVAVLVGVFVGELVAVLLVVDVRVKVKVAVSAAGVLGLVGLLLLPQAWRPRSAADRIR